MSTFGRRKEKKPEYVKPIIIGAKPAPIPEEVHDRGEPTRSGLIVPEGAADLDLRLLGTPEKALSHETVEHEGSDEALAHLTDQDRVKELPIIRAQQPKPVEVKQEAKVTFSPTTTVDHITLGPGDTTLWREAVRPSKKADDK